MIKILAACGAGINSSHQIKNGIEEEMKKRGHEVKVDAVVVKDINKEMMDQYDIFAPISKMKFSFDVEIPTIEAGPILYRIPAMADPVFDQLENAVKELKK